MPVNGLVVMTPTSIASTGTGNSSSINADGSVDFASCETLSLNGVFTSSYDNYMIVMRSKHGSASQYKSYRMRASGTDNTTASSYVSQVLIADSTLSAERLTSNIGYVAGVSSTREGGCTIYVFGPYLAQPTALRGVDVDGKSSARILDGASTHNQSTSYDGITLRPGGTGNFSGLITVFGFNQ